MQKRNIDTVSRRSLLTNLQYLRAVAAYLVVLYHARVLLPASMGPSLEFGRAGVDIFFIISGFIIQHVTSRDNEVRPSQFFVKRAIRVVPFYWALTIAIGVAGLIAPSFAGNGGAPSLSRIIKSILFIPYRDDSGEIHPVLFVGWTLNFEVFFYVVFGASLFVRDATKRLLLVTGVFVGLAAIGLVTQPRGAALATYTNPLLLEFVAGLWLHTLWRKRLGSRLRGSERVASIGMIAISSLALIGSEALWPQSPQLLKWGLPSLIIVFNSLLLERGSVGAVWPHALLLGEASYAIYLLHPIVIKVVSVAAGKVRIEHSAFIGLTFLLTFFLAGVVGAAVHVFVERPIIRALRHRLVPQAPRAIASGA